MKSSSAYCIIPSQATLAALRPLPVEALRLSEEVVDLLHQLGIERIEQVEALPREDLSARFGPSLLQRLDQATGRAAEVLPSQPSLPAWQVEQTLEYPTADRAAIETLLAPLVERLCAMLAEHGQGALRLTCRLDCRSSEAAERDWGFGTRGSGLGAGNFQFSICNLQSKIPCLIPSSNTLAALRPVELSVGLFEPSALPQQLLDLLRMRLERVQLPGPVTAMAVEAPIAVLVQQRQETFFSDQPLRPSRQHLAGLIERLSGRLGQQAVVRVRLLPEAQPERAWRYDPLVASRSSKMAAAPPDLPPRPLRLLSQPARIAAVAVLPDGPPVQLQLHGRIHRIVQAWGPERIETGWWRGQMIGRDYYRVETATGQRYWVFRQLADGKWFLHGSFE